jgi:predicted HicB family RNase H-like nuclease
MLAVKQELHKMVVSAPPDRCTFCGNGGAAGVRIDDGRICLDLTRSAHIRVCGNCLQTDNIVDRIKKALDDDIVERMKKALDRRDAPIEQLEGGAAAKSEEPRCVLCEGEDAMGYRIDEEGIVPAFEAEVEADCFLCEECRERDDFEDQIRAFLERRGVYIDWLHNVDKPKEKLDCQLLIRMSKATREKLDVAAEAHGVTLNKLVNSLIEGGLKTVPRKRPGG